jgi:hypothetical protein
MSNTYVARSYAPTCRKAPRKTRTIRVLPYVPCEDGISVRVTETVGRREKITHYYVRPLPCDFGFAASWEKWKSDGGDGSAYECNIGGESFVGEDPETGEPVTDGTPETCECMGHSAHGRCKHVEGTKVLLQAGKL